MPPSIAGDVLVMKHASYEARNRTAWAISVVAARAVQEKFFDTQYHHPSNDLTQPIECETAVRFARIGYRIAMEDKRPTWNEGDSFGQKFDH